MTTVPSYVRTPVAKNRLGSTPGLPDPTPWGFVLGCVAVVATAWGAWMAWSYL